MPSTVTRGFRHDRLDPSLLATPFEVQTNWHVIAGPPSCGKTTLIDLLASVGFQTVPEPAREFMEGEIARGRTIDEIHRHGDDLQRTLMDLQTSVEDALPPDEVVFLDGALPTSLAWYRAFGLDPNQILQRCFRHRYATVFLLEPLPLDVDNIRFEDSQLVPFIAGWLARDFTDLGYHAIRLPVRSPEGRLAFVLDHLALV